MNNICLYYHGGSGNHGCEAIIRASAAILKAPLMLWSTAYASDRAYGLDRVVELREDKKVPLHGPESLAFKVHHKLTGSDYLHTTLTHKSFFSAIQPGDVCLSVGGDNYCYAGKDILRHYNKAIHKKGGKTVLWGCSFEPSDMDETIARDIARYDLITARESISYDVLKAVNPRTIQVADPAFVLESVCLPLPEGWWEGNTIGINASPLILQSARNEGVAYDAYRRLISHILESTDCAIALIPHVVLEGNDDRVPLRRLYEEFSGTRRIVLIDDHNCCELKGFISRCRLFIGARTHATIAAYSTCVPTLALGYSVKSKGIARDIFGTAKQFVLSVQEMEDPNELAAGFEWLLEREGEIRAHLVRTMPAYRKRALSAGEAIERLMDK
ncbi:MAG: polysaccharide pyruvyl transferase family protein [Oscillospiraceae bacterium]|nr:polysaccharide pyruvyl transferase family protein [Oscillospiraceae bacterium]